MDRPRLNYIIDIGLAAAFLISAVTGVLKWPGFARALGLRLTAKVSIIHDWSGIILAALVLVHLIMHYEWIKCMTKNIFGKGEECD